MRGCVVCGERVLRGVLCHFHHELYFVGGLILTGGLTDWDSKLTGEPTRRHIPRLLSRCEREWEQDLAVILRRKGVTLAQGEHAGIESPGDAKVRGRRLWTGPDGLPRVA